jgi:hypothetical protein
MNFGAKSCSLVYWCIFNESLAKGYQVSDDEINMDLTTFGSHYAVETNSISSRTLEKIQQIRFLYSFQMGKASALKQCGSSSMYAPCACSSDVG